MSDFRSASEGMLSEHETRKNLQVLRFGISFIDDSLYGIMPDDLILIGAPSGVGKTELVTTIARANIEDGKKVHLFALEAGRDEIEQRIKWRYIINQFYSDPDRLRGVKPLYDEWKAGHLEHVLGKYEDWATKFCATAYKNLSIFYKSEDDFNVNKLIEMAVHVSQDTDLMIIDHAHYFDFDDDNENRALKEIAKTVRSIALELRKPIILVAHLRKRGFGQNELVANLDDFHGSSDLVKIPTKAVTFAPGLPESKNRLVTFVRTPKNRINGSSKTYMARMIYDASKGEYEEDYKVGWANAKDFEEVEHVQKPDWLHRTRRRRMGSGGIDVDEGREVARIESVRKVKRYPFGDD